MPCCCMKLAASLWNWACTAFEHVETRQGNAFFFSLRSFDLLLLSFAFVWMVEPVCHEKTQSYTHVADTACSHDVANFCSQPSASPHGVLFITNSAHIHFLFFFGFLFSLAQAGSVHESSSLFPKKLTMLPVTCWKSLTNRRKEL